MGNIVRHNIDPLLVATIVPLLAAGLATMYSFTGSNIFFERQLIWIVLGFITMIVLSQIDWRFLRNTRVVLILFSLSVAVLLALFIFGTVTQGAQSRFNLGFLFVQPSDPIKLVLVIVLAKYFSRRHVEIARLRHVFISGVYAFVLFALIAVQPDFGSAIILFFTWFGMVLVSGISKRHLALVFGLGAVAFLGLWMFVFQDYQKARIITFVDPLADIQGTGYSVYQSTIAIGSGQVVGKGFGYGTQSRLDFLPEYETDFIFAAFAEEWGLIGVLIITFLFGIVIWRMLSIARHGQTNFEVFFGLGLIMIFVSHLIVHVGGNVGLLPVTGTTMPFLSYGGSHLMMEFAGIGMLLGMRRYAPSVSRDGIYEHKTSTMLSSS